MTFGPHLLGEMHVDPDLLDQSGGDVYVFLKQLVDVIGMETIGSPHLDLYSGPHREWNGWSATIHIQTSHITMHLFEFGFLFIDIFSCKPFDQGAAIKYIEETWGATNAHWQSLERGATFPPEMTE